MGGSILEWGLVIIKAILCTYTISICISNINKKQLGIFFVLSIIVNSFVNLAFNFASISIVIGHIITLLCIYLIFDINEKRIIISSCIYYIVNNIYMLLSFSISHIYARKIFFTGDESILISKIVLILYIFFAAIYILGKENIVNIYKKIDLDDEIGNAVLFASIIFDFIAVLFKNQMTDGKLIFHQFLVLFIQVFFIIAVICTCKIYNRSKLIFRLSRELESKNRELKIIKDGHAEILSYMSRLYKAGCAEEIGTMLKSIINGEDVKITDSMNYSNNSILAIMINKAIDNEIEVNCIENDELSLCKMKELELYQVINNIVNNAIRVLKKQKEKILNIRINQENENLIIEIENNGPKIDDILMEKIFEAGVTTKKNEDKSHGYGLSIVRELIENNHGEISVSSTELMTNFKIVLPCRDRFNKKI